MICQNFLPPKFSHIRYFNLENKIFATPHEPTIFKTMVIKTRDSELKRQEEAGHMQCTSAIKLHVALPWNL